ncbi:hypothetical protein CHH52_13475 [Shouchella clausii]|nr:hypothetical protein CHH52_13475 [Shouchella clausii]
MKVLQAIPYLNDEKVPYCTHFEIKDGESYIKFLLTDDTQYLLSSPTSCLKFKVGESTYEVGQMGVELSHLVSPASPNEFTEVTLRLSN